MEIKIKYLSDIDPLECHGDMIDLRAAENVMLKAGKYVLIPLGVAMQLPTGYEAHIYPRSSTFAKWGILLANGVGIVDCDYNGDDDQWFFPAYCTRDVAIPKNTRIAQFRIFENQPKFDLMRVDSLGNENRGGLGSTGEV
jgi:dUTP pyrophosphatase